MVASSPQEDRRTELEKTYQEIEVLFTVKSKGYSMSSIRSLIGRKQGAPFNTMYFDVLSVMSGQKTKEEVITEYLNKAKQLNIL